VHGLSRPSPAGSADPVDSSCAPSDEALMTTWLEARDGRVFRALHTRHGPRTYAICIGITRRKPLAEDAHQETWIAVSLASEWRAQSFKGWVSQIAARKAIDEIRRRHNWTPTDDDDHLAKLPSTTSGPEAAAAARHAIAFILEPALDLLPPDQREAWAMRYVREMTFEEIASAQGIPLPSAKTRVRLALEKLHAYLEEHQIAPEALVGIL
jgi:RNA polymerase sigma-70 factor (ECF subfamily)